jgi:hypothetical protein
MKATEARKIAAAANTGDLPEIFTAIERASKHGDYYTHVYFTIKPKDVATLEKEGYKITDVSGSNETCINISWEEAKK